MPPASIGDIFARRRILLSRLLFIPLLVYIVFSSSPLEEASGWDIFVEVLGYVCLVVATLGRIWSLSYVGGYKDGTLITAGPYSIVRNPLYVFNFIGGVGFGLAAEHPEVALGIALVFSVYYPLIVRREERALEVRHGQRFLDYKQHTPRWLPDCRRFQEPETYLVKPAFIRRSMLGSMWFLWLFILWEIVEKLHDFGVIPVLWRIR